MRPKSGLNAPSVDICFVLHTGSRQVENPRQSGHEFGMVYP